MNLPELIEKHSLKVGDEVLCHGGGVFPNAPKTMKLVDRGGRLGVREGGSVYAGDSAEFSLVEAKPTYPNPPHKYAELIKAWADGAVMQYKSQYAWTDVHQNNPVWAPGTAYRIKPQKSAKEIQIEEVEAEMRKLADKVATLKES